MTSSPFSRSSPTGPDSGDLIGGVGSPIVDMIARVPESFLEVVDGEKGGMHLMDAVALDALIERLPSAFTQSPGGAAGNTLFALARLGAPATFVGKLGNDPFGDFYHNTFAAQGGHAGRFKRGDIPNARCLSLVTPDGERTMRTDLGAAMTLTPAEIQAADFLGCRHIHVEGYLLFNRSLFLHVLECIRRAGTTISLDLASFEVVNAGRDILESVLRDSVDLVFANEDEAAAFFADDPIGDDYAEAARRLSELCPVAAVKCGADGAWVCRQGGLPVHVPADKVDAVVDTTGAGDFWAAGFLFGWTKGIPIETCAQFGAILGAAAVQIEGTQPDAVTWERITSRIGI